MQTFKTKEKMTKNNIEEGVLLELTVNNHPGVMSHICGLFSRRAYNLEKILVIPKKNMIESSMWLQVNEERRLDQVIKQIKKLEDVKDLICHPGDTTFFKEVENLLKYDVAA